MWLSCKRSYCNWRQLCMLRASLFDGEIIFTRVTNIELVSCLNGFHPFRLKSTVLGTPQGLPNNVGIRIDSTVSQIMTKKTLTTVLVWERFVYARWTRFQDETLQFDCNCNAFSHSSRYFNCNALVHRLICLTHVPCLFPQRPSVGAMDINENAVRGNGHVISSLR